MEQKQLPNPPHFRPNSASHPKKNRRRVLIPHHDETTIQQQSYLSEYIQSLANERSLSLNTQNAYRRDLTHFYMWLSDRPITGLTIRDLAEYIQWLAGRKLAPASCARHIVSIRGFFRFLVERRVLKSSAADLLDSPKLWERIPSVLTPPQIDKLLAAPVPKKDRFWIRDRAILEMFYATGCRASEVANLTLTDIHLNERFCRCIGKGDKERMVPLSDRAVRVFRQWLLEERANRMAVGRSSEKDWAFLSRGGRRIRREALWELVKKYIIRIDASVTVSPHTLRHSFATHLLAGGADLRMIQEMLGHASIGTTQIYTHIDPSKLKSVHHQFHPRG